jgi:hypothetical protein
MLARRSFVSKLGFGLVGGAAVGAASPAQAQSAESARWQPVRHAQDDWLDQIPGKHRLFFDALTDGGLREVRGFANNYFDANKSGYGLDASDLAVVICLRHMATPFAFNEGFWTKYGPALAESLKLADPKITANPHKAQLDALIKRGVHYAVCDLASHRFAGGLARSTGGNADAIYKDMTEHLIGNAHFVAAGIVAVNRAQERGYAIAYTG